MGLFDLLGGVIGGALAKGLSMKSLKNATKDAPNSMGCYKIYLNGSLKYVGKAEDGLRKRFVQYYNGTTAHYSSAQKIYEHRDKLMVSWVVLSSGSECRKTEAEWIEKYRPIWNKQGGWGGY